MKGDETPIPAGGGDVGVPVVPVMESGPDPDCFLPLRTSAQPLTRKARLRPLIPRLRLRHDRPDSSSQWPVGAAGPYGFLDSEPFGMTLLWQISVVAKEYGHYAAILTVVVVAALLLTAPPFWWACALVLILGVLLTAAFAWPLSPALRLQRQIHARANGDFPADLAIKRSQALHRNGP